MTEQEKKYKKLNDYLMIQSYVCNAPIFSCDNKDAEDNDTPPTLIYFLKKRLIEDSLDFARKQEDRLLEAYSDRLELKDVGSECFIVFTADYGFYTMVKTYNLNNPDVIELFAFTEIKWQNQYHLLQIGKLSAQIKNISNENVANISWISTILPQIQEYSDKINFSRDSREEKKARNLQKNFDHSTNIHPENHGIGSALITKFEEIASKRNVSSIILSSVCSEKELKDEQGNLMLDEDGRTIKIDFNGEIFYPKLKYKPAENVSIHSSQGKPFYKVVRPVHSNELPDDIVRTYFEYFNYNFSKHLSKSSSGFSYYDSYDPSREFDSSGRLKRYGRPKRP